MTNPRPIQIDPAPTGRIGAFFDLDGTLLSVNSGALWLRRERRLGRLSRLQYLEALAYLIAYRINAIDMSWAMRRGLSTIRGEREDTLRGWTRTWYHEEIAHLVAPGAWSTLSWHRDAGHMLVLLTTSSVYQSELAAEQLGMDAYLCSRYEVQDGVFTGEPLFPLCFGAGKVTHAERFAEEHAIDLQHSYFYSDSASDLPMLGRVGHPRVVNPDTKLRARARKQGWKVLDWRKTAA